jgi:hypothetical protein
MTGETYLQIDSLKIVPASQLERTHQPLGGQEVPKMMCLNYQRRHHSLVMGDSGYYDQSQAMVAALEELENGQCPHGVSIDHAGRRKRHRYICMAFHLYLRIVSFFV